MIDPAGIDALLFDFGGVLVEIDFDRMCARWAELAGRPLHDLKARFTLGEEYHRHERGEIDIAAYCEALRRTLDVDLDDEQLLDGWQRVFVGEIEPTVRLVEALRGRIPMYVFSNTNVAHYEHFRHRFAAALAPFERIFTSHEIGARKPERAAFERIARETGVAMDRMLFLDDTPANVEGAHAAGMPAVLVRAPADVHEALRPWLDVAANRTGT
ncbi:MAG: HAD-IA family hydrolase [Betaproteobacteria bacterium]